MMSKSVKRFSDNIMLKLLNPITFMTSDQPEVIAIWHVTLFDCPRAFDPLTPYIDLRFQGLRMNVI